MSETLYRKYRPQTFGEVTNQNHVKMTIQNQLRAGTVAHAYLFTGPRGVGKTTIARLLARAVNCEKLKDGEPCGACPSCAAISGGRTMDIMEIDAASHTGVDNVRENIIDAARFAPSQLKKKVFIIDEVHGLSLQAFNALLKTLEEPPAQVLFILATTELHKVPETIVSRCQRFDFHRLRIEDIVERLQSIAKQEKIKVDTEVLEAIARRSEGCLRDAESLFGQVLAIGDGKKIGMDEALLVLPATNAKVVAGFLDALFRQATADALAVISAAVDHGVRVDPLIDEIIEALRERMMQDLNRQAQKLLELVLEYRTRFGNERIPQLPLELLAMEWGGGPMENGKRKVESGDSSTTPAHKSTLSTASTASTTSSISLSDIKSKWSECLAFVKERSATLPVILQDVELLAVDGETLKVGTRVSFLADQLNEARNRAIMSEALKSVFAEPLLICAECLKVDQNQLVSDLLGEFGGKIVE